VELLTQPTSSVPAPSAAPSRVASASQHSTSQHSTSQPEQPPPTHEPARQAASAPQPPATQQPSTQQPSAQQQAEPRAAPREVVRDLSPQQNKQSKRARNQRQRDDVRTGNTETAAAEQVDPREARAPERQRTATQVDTERRDGRRFERRYRDRDRDEAEEADVRSRFDRNRRGREFDDRRQRTGEREGERRVVVREEIKESEPRIVRGPEQRDVGFSPFQLFGIFER
jgi:hypothetical protein